MIAAVGLKPKDAWKLTFKELTYLFDGKLLADWDHTAMLAAKLYNLSMITLNVASGKNKFKPKGYLDFHPYRKKPLTGLKITPKNMSVLRELVAVAWAGGK